MKSARLPETPMVHPSLPGYKFFTTVGQGSYASVYRAVHISTNKIVAIKRMSISYFEEEVFEDSLQKEVSIMKKIDCPFIVKYFDSRIFENHLYIIMEFLPCGSLKDLIERDKQINEDIARVYIGQLVAAVFYLHERKHVVHRDIKAENILLDNCGTIRLIDFGFANDFDYKFPLLKTICGSLAYTSPEMINNERYTPSVDIWSIGVLLYILVTGNLPFKGESTSEMINSILNDSPPYPHSLSSSLIDLIKAMLEKDGFKRISIASVVNHPWMEPVKHYVELCNEIKPEKVLSSPKVSDFEISKIILSRYELSSRLPELMNLSNAIKLVISDSAASNHSMIKLKDFDFEVYEDNSHRRTIIYKYPRLKSLQRRQMFINSSQNSASPA